MEALTFIMLGAGAIAALVFLQRNKMSFISQHPDDYDAQGPELNLRDHLNGPIICEGVLYGPTGRVTSRFVADMHVTWDGNDGTITEPFKYSDGSTQDR